ncbi:hypothetical protein AHiyo1_24210 [Arthrobacter sp. Hiyo1]|nr:hypothetical protein AHiyo1_24210 [Arthrobacter sp. Hiyo1]
MQAFDGLEPAEHDVDAVPQQLGDQIGLAAEIVVDRSLGHPGCGRDLVHGDARCAALADQLHRSVEKALLGRVGAGRAELLLREPRDIRLLHAHTAISGFRVLRVQNLCLRTASVESAAPSTV